MEIMQQIKDIIIEEYKKGNSVNAISKKYGLTFQATRKVIAEKVPIKKKPNLITNEKMDEVAELWNNGVKNPEYIAKLAKISKSQVYKILHAYGLFEKTPCDTVLLIRNAHSQGIPNIKIANMLGVSRQYVSSTLKKYE